MIVRKIVLVVCIALLAVAGGAAGEEEEQALQPSHGSAAGPMLHGKLELSLGGAVAMGLENNLDVQVQRYSPLIAGYDEEIAWGAFDPQLFAEFGYLESKTPNTNALFNRSPENVQRLTDGFGGLRGIVPLLSSEYDFRYDGSRDLTNSDIIALSPELRSGWSLNLTQPLLKDLVWNEPWTQVKTTRLVHDASREDFRRAVMDVVRSIEDAYWVLIAEEERYRVGRKSVETAKALLDQTKTQHEVGVVSKVEVTEAEAGLARREFEVIVAENRYRNQMDVLIDLVLGPHLRAASTLELEPTDRPQDYTLYEVDVEAAVARAFEFRPELAAARKEVERQTIQVKFASNQRLPELDGILSFGQSGAAGAQNPLFNPCRFASPADLAGCVANPPDVSQGGFGNTFDDYNDNPALTAGLRFGIPIPNTTARKRHSRTQLELRRAESQLRRAEQQVILEVREASRNLEASQEGIESAERALTSADEQLNAERIRLEYGESTPFDVLQREEQYVEAEVGLIDAYRAYRVSATALDRFQGTILRNRNIKIDQVSALR
jgi:outer membrane protein TolC